MLKNSDFKEYFSCKCEPHLYCKWKRPSTSCWKWPWWKESTNGLLDSDINRYVCSTQRLYIYTVDNYSKRNLLDSTYCLPLQRLSKSTFILSLASQKFHFCTNFHSQALFAKVPLVSDTVFCKYPIHTEGEIKYIPFIAYLDAPRDPRGVKRCAIIH